MIWLALSGCILPSERPFLADRTGTQIALGFDSRMLVLYENGWLGSNGSGGRGGRYQAIAMDDFTKCAVSENGNASCWGAGSFDQLNQEIVGDFHSITIRNDVACAWGDDESACWGDNSQGAAAAVSIPGVIDMASNRLASCAATEDGVACFGSNGPDYFRDEVFTSLTFVGLSLCGSREDDTVQCWGSGDLPIPPQDVELENLASSGSKGCGLVVGTGKPECFGTLDDGVPLSTPNHDAVDVAIGDEQACALVVDSGIPECWAVDNWFML